MPKNPDIYISLDHETDGPCAGINNLLTFGAAAFTQEGEPIDTFYERIIQLPYLKPNPETMIWWRTQTPGAYKEAFDEDMHGIATGPASRSRTTAFDAMLNLSAWLNRINDDRGVNRFIPMGWPAAFDFAFTNYYCHRFLGANPLGYACLDIRSYAMGLFRKSGYYELKEEEINQVFGKLDKGDLNAHVAVDDAIAQGQLFFHLRNHDLASPKLIQETWSN